MHSTICKHIHHINILYFSSISNTEENRVEIDDATGLEDIVPPANSPSHDLDEHRMTSLEYLENQLNSVSTKHTSSKDRALTLCKKIEVSLLECTNTDAIIAGVKHLQSALTVINSKQMGTQPTVPTKKRLAPNAF